MIADDDTGRDIGDILTSIEPAYHLLAWASSGLGLGVYGVNFVTSSIFVFVPDHPVADRRGGGQRAPGPGLRGGPLWLDPRRLRG